MGRPEENGIKYIFVSLRNLMQAHFHEIHIESKVLRDKRKFLDLLGTQ